MWGASKLKGDTVVHFPERKRVYRGNAAADAVAMPISRMAPNGFAQPQTRRRGRAGRALPLREAMSLIAVLLLMRIVLAADMGLAGYMAKADALAQGTWMEQQIALAMPLDPISKSAAEGLGTVLAFFKR